MDRGCPPTEFFVALATRTDFLAQHLEVEAHVETCPDCRDRLERIAAGSTSFPSAGPDLFSPPPEIPGFTFVAELGRGGGGVVHEAIQNQVGRRVAIKILRGDSSVDAAVRRRWLAEARAMAKVRHSHIVRLHELGEHRGFVYLVLDHIAGGSLRDRLDGPIPPRTAAGIVETIADAAHAIHEQGLLHLDIKPSNILLDGPNADDLARAVPVLTDFGIAVDEGGNPEGSRSAGTFGPCGTPWYMAPEQLLGKRSNLGPATDVFALGATLYHLLTGRPAFQAASTIETFDLIRSAEPPPPRSLVPSIPRDLETICLAALRKSPARRYPSAQAMAEDLRRAIDGSPIQARPYSTAERAARWCARRPLAAGLAGTLTLTIVASLFVVTLLWRRSEEARDRAEAGRVRAERSEQTTELVANRLIEFITHVLEKPERSLDEQLDDSLRRIIDLMSGLRSNPKLSRSQAIALGSLQVRLIDHLRAQAKFDSAYRFLAESIDQVRSALTAVGDDDGLASTYLRLMIAKGELAVEMGRLDDSSAAAEEATRVVARIADRTDSRAVLVRLHGLRAWVAEMHERKGDPAGAARVRDGSLAVFRALSRANPDDPILDFVTAMVEAGEGLGDRILEIAEGRVRRLPRDDSDAAVQMRGDLGGRIAWALTVPLDPNRSGGRPTTSPSVAATRLLDTIRGLRDRGCDPRLEFDIIHELAERAAVQAIDARRAGRLDDTRWTIAWMLELGRPLVADPISRAGGRIMLSKAYEQEYKLGRHLDDLAIVEPALRRALLEASEALALIPDHEWTRRHVAALREKYIRAVLDEKNAQRPEPTP